MANELGSSATLISAAIQSSGYFYQSIILDDLGYYLSHPVAVLIFIFGAIGAVLRFVTEGDVKTIKWLLVGPVVFFAVLGSRTPVTNAQWRFGDRVYNDQVVRNKFQPSLPSSLQQAPVPKAEVASLFAAYNRMISSVVQSVIDSLTTVRKNVDTNFIIRSELLSMMQASTVPDADFRDLIQTAFLGNCRSCIAAAKDLTDFSKPEEVRKLEEERAKGNDETPDASTVRHSLGYEKGVEIFKKTFAQALIGEQTLSGGAYRWVESVQKSDKELYCVAMAGDTARLSEFISNRFLLTKEDSSRPDPTTIEFSRLPAECQALLETPLASKPLTCQQVWSFVYAGLLAVAPTVVSNVVETGKKNGIAPNDLVSDLLAAKGYLTETDPQKQGGQFNAIYRVAAHYLLRNELERGSLSSFINRFANRGFEYSVLRGVAESDLALIERQRVRNNEWQEKSKMLFTAALLPYYQGVALFFLSILFPFFALLLLFPGRYGAFLQWFILWLWVKSWDVGFAVVMMMDDILFTIYSKMANLERIERTVGLNRDMQATFAAFRELDPTMQLGTYYMLMSVAVGSVPIISSYLILGSLKGGAGLIANGARSFVQSFASRASDLEGQGITSGARVKGAQMEQDTAKTYIQNAMAGKPRTEGADVQYPNTGSGIGGVPQRTSPTQSLQSMADEVVRLSREVGASSALTSSGFYSSYNNLNPILGLPLVSLFRGGLTGTLKAQATMDKVIMAQRRDEYEAHFNSNLQKLTVSAIYDATNSEAIQRLHPLAAVNRQLFIPLWNLSSSAEELGHEMMAWEQGMKRLAAPIAATEAAVSQGLFGALVALGRSGAYGESRSALAGRTYGGNLPPTFPVDVNLGGGLNYPVANGRVGLNSRWGLRYISSRPDGEVHAGVDLAAKTGDSIVAAADGVVIYSGFLGSKERGYGNTVILRHNRGGQIFFTTYSHGSGFPENVAVGATVSAGQRILYAGSTGFSEAPHLHFGVTTVMNGQLVNINPAAFMGGAGSAKVQGRREPNFLAGQMLYWAQPSIRVSFE